VSKSLRSDTLEIFNIKKDIQVVPNFIDIEKYETLRTTCSRDQLAKPNERLVTHVSNFRPVKRVQDVLSVFAKLNKEVKSRLIMVGDGPERLSAEEYCKELGLSDVVDFVGKSNDVYRILCSSDLFLLPSQKESFGLAALEAMAARTPVIATDEGGIPEVVEHQSSGFLSAHGDVDTMASHAVDLLNDETKLQQFKDAAFTRAKVFDIQKVIPLYIDIYNKALG
jgi:N-acetyl-alpha-D-glucosaminyl L-malate synthase BshA